MLTHCPICKYDLTGLPDRHKCPECAFEFDRNCDLLQLEPVPRWLRWFLILFMLMLMFNLAAAWIRKSGFLWLMIPSQLLAFLSVDMNFRSNRPVALVRPGDVQIIRRRTLHAQYSLVGVVSARWEFVDGGVRLLNAQGSELSYISKNLRWSANATKKLAAIINTRLKASAQAS